jgi:hypothetical protein
MRYLACLAVLGGLFLAGCTGDGTVKTASPAASASGSHQSASALTSNTSGKLLPGSTVTSKIHFGAGTFAAGAMFGQAAQRSGDACANGCNPVVWASSGSGWRVVLKVPAKGSIADEHLLATPFGLLVFNSDEGTALWRSRVGRTWAARRLPGPIASSILKRAVVKGRRLYVHIETTQNGSETWFTTDGRTWRRQQ